MMTVWIDDEIPVLPRLAAAWMATVKRRAMHAAYAARLPIALTGALVGAISIFVALSPARSTFAVVPADPGRQAWSRQPDATPRLLLASPALAPAPVRHEIWLRDKAGKLETEYRFGVGSLEDDRAFALVVIGDRASPDTSLFLDSARHAAHAGLAIARYGRVADHRGRLGTTETASIFLTNGAALARECIAWRAHAGDHDGNTTQTWAGFLCPPLDRKADDAQIECLLRELVPSGGAEPDIRHALAQSSGPAPPGCAATFAAFVPPNTGRLARVRH